MAEQKITDTRGNEPGTDGWRQINDTWVYLGCFSGLYMYQKFIGKMAMPDVRGLTTYAPALDWAAYRAKQEGK